MLLNPRIGQLVQIWYGEKARSVMPYHGQVGRVVIRCRRRGKHLRNGPRNHAVEIDGRLVVVPCGNLRIPNDE
jgi:hypothetical protein